MLILQVEQLHTKQKTGRSLMAFSTVAAPACFAASLLQEAKNLSHQAPKQGWHSQAGKQLNIFNYCGYALDIVSPGESSAGSLPYKKR